MLFKEFIQFNTYSTPYYSKTAFNQFPGVRITRAKAAARIAASQQAAATATPEVIKTKPRVLGKNPPASKTPAGKTPAATASSQQSRSAKLPTARQPLSVRQVNGKGLPPAAKTSAGNKTSAKAYNKNPAKVQICADSPHTGKGKIPLSRFK